MNNMIVNIRTQLQKLKCRIANLSNRVTYIEDNCCDGGGDGIQSIQEGDNISIDNTDPQNPIISALGGDTPTLSEVLAEGNVADRDIELSIGLGSSSFLGKGTPMGSIYFNVPTLYQEGPSITESVNINGFRSQDAIDNMSFGPTFKHPSLGSFYNITSSIENFKGIRGFDYYGANYDDNTYVQKKYVDDAIDAIPTPSLTLEQARQNGNVFEGDVELINEARFYSTADSSTASFGTNNDGGGTYPSMRLIEEGDESAFYLTGTYAEYNNDNPSATGIVGNQEFDKQGDRKAFAQIADVEDFYTTITGYDAEATQTLKNVNGVLTWITD